MTFQQTKNYDIRDFLHKYFLRCFIWFQSKSNLHAHVHIGVGGSNEILAVGQLPSQLHSNVGKCYHDGKTNRGPEDESVGITCDAEVVKQVLPYFHLIYDL